MIYELMKSRRSVRQFKPEPPSREQIERLIEAAITAPSASNKQPWRFLVVTNREIIVRLAAAVRESVDRIASHVEPSSEQAFRSYGDYFTRFETAPVVIVPIFKSLTVLSNLIDDRLSQSEQERIAVMERNSGLMGAAMAMENLLLVAHEMRLGASGMTGPLVASDRIREILDIRPLWDIAAFIPVGFAAEEPPATGRKPADQVTRWIE